MLHHPHAGTVRVVAYDGTELHVSVSVLMWGENEQDAIARADETLTEVTRDGHDLHVTTRLPVIICSFGLVTLKEPQISMDIQVPSHMFLQLSTDDSDIHVKGPVTDWDIASQTGPIALDVDGSAGFRYHLRTQKGKVSVRIPETEQDVPIAMGTYGTGIGMLRATSQRGRIVLSVGSDQPGPGEAAVTEPDTQ